MSHSQLVATQNGSAAAKSTGVSDEIVPVTHDQITWTQSPNAESVFAKHIARWIWHPKIDIKKEIDVDASKKNTARFGHPIIKDTQAKLAAAIRLLGGLHLPAPVFYRNEDGLLVSLDGVNRIEHCLTSHYRYCAGYELVDVGPATREMIHESLNALGSENHTMADLLQHAVEFSLNPENKHVKLSEVALKYMLPDTETLTARRVIVSGRRLLSGDTMQVPHVDRLEDSVITMLMKQKFTHPVIRQAAIALTSFAKVRIKEAKRFIDAVKSAPNSEKARLERVELEFNELVKRFGLNGVVKEPKGDNSLGTKTRYELTRISNFLANNWGGGTCIGDVFKDKDERQQVNDHLQALKKNVNKMLKSMKA